MTLDFDKMRASLFQVGTAPAEGLGDYVFGGRIKDAPTVAAFHWDLSAYKPVDLTNGQDRVENQGTYGMCVGEGTTTMLELFKARRGLPVVELSPLFTYYATRDYVAKAIGGTVSDSGTSAFCAMAVSTMVGACKEVTWPQSNGVNVKPSAAAYAEAAQHLVGRYERLGKAYGSPLSPPMTQRDLIADIKVALAMGLPVIVCIPVAASFFNCSGPVETHPAQWEQTYINAPNSIGCHCMAVVEGRTYNGGRDLFVTQNSWGAGWGDGGFWGVDAQTLAGMAFDCFVVRSFDGVDGGAIPLEWYVWDDTTAMLDDGRMVTCDAAGTAAKAFRLYQAAFNRRPDEGGLGYWVHFLEQGYTLADAAGGFLNSPEARAMYDALSDVDYVTTLYRNALHREPEPAGLAFWVARLHGGGETRASVLVGFSESPENRGNTDPVIKRGIVFQPVN